jgi:DNA-binding MarR family transcriptional regulator
LGFCDAKSRRAGPNYLTESYKYSTFVGVAAKGGDELDAIERALETLFRLNASRKVHSRLAAAAGVVISQPGYVLLRRIHEDGPLSLGDLAKRSDMDPAATGRQVRQLEADGLVQRGPSSADGRVTFVRVTPRGRDVRRRINEVTYRHMEDVLQAWSRQDRAALGTLLGRLVDDLRTVQYRSLGLDEEAG